MCFVRTSHPMIDWARRLAERRGRYEKPRTPIRAVLVHIDKGWIERVMERIWKNKLRGGDL